MLSLFLHSFAQKETVCSYSITVWVFVSHLIASAKRIEVYVVNLTKICNIEIVVPITYRMRSRLGLSHTRPTISSSCPINCTDGFHIIAFSLIEVKLSCLHLRRPRVNVHRTLLDLLLTSSCQSLQHSTPSKL